MKTNKKLLVPKLHLPTLAQRKKQYNYATTRGYNYIRDMIDLYERGAMHIENLKTCIVPLAKNMVIAHLVCKQCGLTTIMHEKRVEWVCQYIGSL